MSEQDPIGPLHTYADPPRPSSDAADSRSRGRERRRELGFDALLAAADRRIGPAAAEVAAALATGERSGIEVMLLGDVGLDALAPVASGGALVLDVVSVDDALPGPFEIDVVMLGAELARWSSGKRRRVVVEDFARHYRHAIHHLAETPAHAREERARIEGVAALDTARRHLRIPPARTVEGAVARLIADRDGAPRLRRSRVRAWADAEVRPAADDPVREIAQVRETLPEAESAWLSSYRVADAVDVGSGDRLALLAGADPGDRVILWGAAARPSTLEPVLGAWREGSDLQRVLLARARVPLAPAGTSGWSTSPDGSIGRAWMRLRTTASPTWGFTVRDRDLPRWAAACGTVLGLVHGRTGDVHALAGYLGRSTKFDRALGDALTRSRAEGATVVG